MERWWKYIGYRDFPFCSPSEKWDENDDDDGWKNQNEQENFIFVTLDHGFDFIFGEKGKFRTHFRQYYILEKK